MFSFYKKENIPIKIHFGYNPGADTGFRKWGEVWVLKCGVFARNVFSPLYEVWGSPKKGGGVGPDPQDPPPPSLEPPLITVG